MALRAFWQHHNRHGIVDRIEVHDAEFSGTEFELCGDSTGFSFQHDEITSESNDKLINIQANRVQIGKLDFRPRIENSEGEDLLTDIRDSDNKRFHIEWYKDGSFEWAGWITTRIFSYPEKSTAFFAQIRATDFEILKGIDHPFSDTRQTFIDTFVEIFNDLPTAVPIRTATSWTESHLDNTLSADYDFLAEIYHETRAMREFATSGDEADQPISKWDALQRMTDPALLIRQMRGHIHIDQITELVDPQNVQETTYDATGTVTSATAPTNRVQAGHTSVSNGTPAVKITSDNDTYPALKRARTRYEHRTQVSNIEFPDLISIVDSGTRDFQQLFIGDGTQRIAIDFDVRADTDINQASMNGRFRISIDNYDLQDDGSWGTDQNLWYEIELTRRKPFPGGGSVWTGSADAILTDPIPNAADGALTIEFAGATGNVDFADTTRYSALTWNIENPVAEENSTAIDYHLTQSEDYPENINVGTTYFGDGPTGYSSGALRYGTDDQDTTGDSWAIRGETNYINFHHNLLNEVMDMSRTSVRRLRADIWGAYNPSMVLDYNGAYFFYVGGRYDGVTGSWQVTLMEITRQTASDDFEKILDFDSATRGRTIDSSSYGFTLQNRKFNETQYITTTSAAVSGTITSIPINPIGSEFIDLDDTFYVYDVVDASLNEFTLAESQLANDTELQVEETALANPIPANSWVIYTGELISSYLTRSDTSVRIGVNNHEHLTTGDGQIIGTGQGDELAAGFGNKEAQFQGVGAEISVNQSSIEATVRDVDGNSSMLQLLSDQAVLKVDSNGSIAQVELDGSADDGSVINITADDVNINNINFNQEAGSIGSDNFEEAVSGWQIDGEGDAEFNSVALRNGVLEDSEIRNLEITGTLNVPGGNVSIGAEVYDSPGLGLQDGTLTASGLISDQGFDIDSRSATGGQIEFHDTDQVDDLVSNSNIVGELQVNFDDSNEISTFLMRAQTVGAGWESEITLNATNLNINADEINTTAEWQIPQPHRSSTSAQLGSGEVNLFVVGGQTIIDDASSDTRICRIDTPDWTPEDGMSITIINETGINFGYRDHIMASFPDSNIRADSSSNYDHRSLTKMTLEYYDGNWWIDCDHGA